MHFPPLESYVIAQHSALPDENPLQIFSQSSKLDTPVWSFSDNVDSVCGHTSETWWLLYVHRSPWPVERWYRISTDRSLNNIQSYSNSWLRNVGNTFHKIKYLIDNYFNRPLLSFLSQYGMDLSIYNITTGPSYRY